MSTLQFNWYLVSWQWVIKICYVKPYLSLRSALWRIANWPLKEMNIWWLLYISWKLDCVVLMPSLRTFPQVAYEDLKYESHLCYHFARQSQVGVGNRLFRNTIHLPRNTNLLETCIPNSNLSFITQSFRDRFKVISCLFCFVFVTVVWSFLVTGENS